MTIFVDCDDTLILWDKNPPKVDGLYMGDEYRVNKDLIDILKNYYEADRAEIIVWSNGGKDYADMWRRKFLADISFKALAKDVSIPTHGDVCIDDQPIKVNATLYTPDEFIYLYSMFGD